MHIRLLSLRAQRILLRALIIGLLFAPASSLANYYTLPIDELGDSDISNTAWFDHDSTSGQMTRFTGVIYMEDEAARNLCAGYNNGFGCYDGHRGTDYGTSGNEKEILAANAGKVGRAKWQDPDPEVGYGFHVALYHATSSHCTVYAHMASTSLVSVDDELERYQQVGTSSDTGDGGFHLHFGVYDATGTFECASLPPENQIDPYGWWGSGADPRTNNQGYLWTTDPPSFDLASTAPSTIATSQTWRGNFVIDGTVTVNSGVTLTIEPGTVVKFKATTSTLVVNGTLDADGTEAAPIYFTSYSDDTVGGDTNDDATSTTPFAGEWQDIKINSGGTATLEHAILRYGGNSAGSQANIYNNGGTLTMTRATTTDSYNYGIRAGAGTTTCSFCDIGSQWTSVYQHGGSLTVATSTIHDNGFFGVFSGNTGTLNLNNNTFYDNDAYGAAFIHYGNGLSFSHTDNTSSLISGPNGINGFMTIATINSSPTWTKDSMPYVIHPYLPATGATGTMIPEGQTLTIDPGVVVKLASSTASLNATGTITAIGTSEEPIIFTSVHDDDADGHDTNSSSTDPAKGDWRWIQIGNEDLGTGTFIYTMAGYGGYSGVGIYLNGSSTLTIASSTIATSSSLGIWHHKDGGTLKINNSNIVNVNATSYGLYSDQESVTDAENNYWGASDGPQPTGSGVWVGGDPTPDYTPHSETWVSW